MKTVILFDGLALRGDVELAGSQVVVRGAEWLGATAKAAWLPKVTTLVTIPATAILAIIEGE